MTHLFTTIGSKKEAKNYPLVSVISINYNTEDLTIDMLRSLRNITYPNIEVIVIDNASTKGTPEKIKDYFKDIRLIMSEENLGFAGGNNLGLDHANGDYFLFLNNDTEVEPDFIEPMVSRLQSLPWNGVVSSKIRFHHSPDTIQYAGSTPMNPITLRNGHIGFGEKDHGQYDEARPTSFAHGASMLVDAKVIEEVGRMEPGFFLYYEEQDWCERIKRAGYIIWYEPASLIWHKESMSTGKNSVLKTYYLNRNRILFARRNYSGINLLMSFVYMVCISIPKNTISLLRDVEKLKAYYKALGWNLRSHKKLTSIARP